MNLQLQKIKTLLLLALFSLSSFNIYAQSTSLISACSDFDAGPTAWPYVLVATTVADGASSQGAQTFTMNVTDTASGANFRVVKTTANGNFFFGPAIAMTLGSNSITVPAVTFDRTVKFQFSSGDVEFDFLSLNGDTSACVAILGCTDSLAINYDLLATLDDGSCIYPIFGCTDSTAYNYNLNANISDSSCIYCYSSVTDTFLFTGGIQSFIVPNGVDSINVYLSGAQGSLGGLGGSIQADLSVSNDSIIYIYVGGQGLTQYGGWNGGGSSGSVAPGGGGGGASDIRIGGNSLSNRVIVAGGGGGRGITGSGATTGYGGAGGQTSYNLSAGNGTYYAYGTGASVTSPGVGGLYFPWGSGNNGGLGYGGSYCSTCFNMGGGQGGGGSGYYGGGAGGANSGGGGGSNMANSSFTSNILTFQGNNTGHGKIIISYSNTYTNTVMATSCDSYDWDGVTYDSTGIYTNTYTGYNGCDSTVFLDLTINNSSSSNSIISACGSYIFNGLILTSSGTYTDTLLAINSCDSIVTIDLSFGVYGCTDSLAWNFDSLATCDDGSCLYSYMCNNPYPNGLFADNIVDIRATIHWNNMNTDSCRVWKNFIRYKKVTDNTWTTKAAGVGSGLCNVGLPTQQKILQNLAPNTTYEYKMKSFYCGGMESGYSPTQQFTTTEDCPEMTNLSVQTFGGNHYKARFSWDTTGAYVFARIALRIDTAGANWQTAGGFGIYYPSLSVNKFGLQSGQSYRAQGRTFCDANITIYRSWWTSPIFWNQPGSIRLNGGTTINNLDIYPNPTDNIFNVSFVSEEIQSLSVRLLNIVGEVLYEESLDRFIGEYTKQISLGDYSKGIYLLEVRDNKGTINKKIILQ